MTPEQLLNVFRYISNVIQIGSTLDEGAKWRPRLPVITDAEIEAVLAMSLRDIMEQIATLREKYQ